MRDGVAGWRCVGWWVPPRSWTVSVMTGQGRPAYDEFAALVASQAASITELEARITQQDARIADLSRQLGADSRHSSKPSSSDGLGRPAPKALRARTGRTPGGQAGHPGSTLEHVVNPDRVIVHDPECCTGCGASLEGARQTGVVRRQVFGLPEPRVIVTEHQLISRRCACGRVLTAASGSAP